MNWHKGVPEYTGRKITQDKKVVEHFDGWEHIESRANKGLSLDPKVIHQGANSGYQAINLAYHLGAERILLLGYDMQFTNGKAHWFGEHPDRIRSSYAGWLGNYQSIANQLPGLNLEIINCTRETALHAFDKMDLEQALSLGPGPV